MLTYHLCSYNSIFYRLDDSHIFCFYSRKLGRIGTLDFKRQI